MNTVTKTVYDAFGVTVVNRTVRHPQYQEVVERLNRTLLTMLGMTVDVSNDWKTSIGVLLYYYHSRMYSASNISSFQAMMGRRPANLLVESKPAQMTLSAWCDHLQGEASRVCDFVEMELSPLDFAENVFEPPFAVLLSPKLMFISTKGYNLQESLFVSRGRWRPCRLSCR